MPTASSSTSDAVTMPNNQNTNPSYQGPRETSAQNDRAENDNSVPTSSVTYTEDSSNQNNTPATQYTVINHNITLDTSRPVATTPLPSLSTASSSSTAGNHSNLSSSSMSVSSITDSNNVIISQSNPSYTSVCIAWEGSSLLKVTENNVSKIFTFDCEITTKMNQTIYWPESFDICLISNIQYEKIKKGQAYNKAAEVQIRLRPYYKLYNYLKRTASSTGRKFYMTADVCNYKIYCRMLDKKAERIIRGRIVMNPL